jgi:hypothetical protein
MGDGWLETLDAGNRRGGWSSDVKEVTDRITPFEAFNASFFSFISSRVPAVSSGSLKTTGLPPSSNLIFLNAEGVGEDARGYSLGSSSRIARGGLINNGGKVVVVVVVVVTTVVCVAGAKEN